MMALSKFLVLLGIFLLANLGNAFIILRLVSGRKQNWVNHLIEFEEPINKVTHEPTCKPTNELLIDL